MNEQFFLGYPVEFKNICLVYPPKIKEIISNSKYGMYNKLLTFSQEEIEDEFVSKGWDLKGLLTPFEFLLNNAYHDRERIEVITKEAFEFFIHEPVTILYEQKVILIGEVKQFKKIEDLRILREADFFEFQNLIRQATGGKVIEPPRADEDPRVKAIKAKARYRDKIKEKKGLGLKLSTSLAAICCMNMSLNPLNIGELSYAAVPILMNMYQEKEKYNLDIDSILAGGDSKKIKPQYWIRNLED